METLYRKYGFNTKATAEKYIRELGQDEDGNPTHPHNVQVLGFHPITPAVLDEEGNEVTPAVLSTTYNVDVLWFGAPPAKWTKYEAWPAPFGALVMGASNVQREWLETCKIKAPHHFPEPELDENV